MFLNPFLVNRAVQLALGVPNLTPRDPFEEVSRSFGLIAMLGLDLTQTARLVDASYLIET